MKTVSVVQVGIGLDTVSNAASRWKMFFLFYYVKI